MSSDPVLVVRRVSGVDLRATVELLVHQQRAHGNDLTEDELRPVVQDTLEDSTRTLVLGESAWLMGPGILIGLLAAAAGVSLARAALIDVSPLDPAVYATAAVCQGVVVILAGWWPARRAAQSDPLDVLRAE